MRKEANSVRDNCGHEGGLASRSKNLGRQVCNSHKMEPLSSSRNGVIVSSLKGWAVQPLLVKHTINTC